MLLSGKFIENLNKFKNVYSDLAVLASVVILGYNMYTGIVNKMEANRIAIETTQIMLLKKYVRDFEHTHHCRVSDQEWDEYILNYSTLFDLKVKNGLLSDKAPWRPIQRNLKECES